ncbi:MAG TPA: hypothetical protein VMV69_14265 [Pirellulales bacterium]|nr:hypothetical protein [Pirellulales bacterium]
MVTVAKGDRQVCRLVPIRERNRNKLIFANEPGISTRPERVGGRRGGAKRELV